MKLRDASEKTVWSRTYNDEETAAREYHAAVHRFGLQALRKTSVDASGALVRPAWVQGHGGAVRNADGVLVEVNGPRAHPLFVYLKAKQPDILGQSVKWNFTKWLVDRSGQPVARFSPPTAPLSMVADIEKLLDADAPAAKA